MATITPANLAYKDKDGNLGEVKSLTDTDVTLLNNALQDIEDLKLAYMPGYVKRDFSNVTQDGKDAAIEWGQPDYTSAIAITLTIGTAVNYIAPDDGFIVYTLTAGSTAEAFITVNEANVIYFISGGGAYYPTSTGIVPVHQGDTIKIKANGANSSWMVRGLNYAEFVPCKGV